MLGPNTIAHTCNPKIQAQVASYWEVRFEILGWIKNGKDANQANILA